LGHLRAIFRGTYAIPFDSSLLNQASSVWVRALETSSADLRAINRPLY
jgi:hypothetical protein